MELANHFKLADLYNKIGKPKAAENIYQDLVDNISPIQRQVKALGKYFMNLGLYDYALETYQNAQQKNKKGYQYNLELGELYAATKQPVKMMAAYLDLLEYSPAYLKAIQTYLSNQIIFEEDDQQVDILKKELLKRSQNNPNAVYYNKMLLWFYLQKKSYLGAIIQAKAIDKKQRTQDKNLFEVASICQQNKVYDLAGQAYRSIIKYGPRSPYYTLAIEQNLNVGFKLITENGIFDKVKVDSIATMFEIELSKLGKTSSTIGIIEQLAYIRGYYLSEQASAIQLLEEAINLNISNLTKARLKILLGDILVMDNQIWEASIKYMQVANAFENDKIGHEAKFKNAKIFYYDGEFEYAKAQLDVLKASTTKLIANDAMQLSLLLQDNLGIDTTQEPIQLYAKADLLFQQNKFDQAINMLDSISKTYPFHSIIDELIYQKGIIYSKMKDWPKAIEQFEQIIETYWFDILADDAIFKLAEIYDYRLNDMENAAKYYKKILFDYNSSLYVSPSRERYRAIKAV